MQHVFLLIDVFPLLGLVVLAKAACSPFLLHVPLHIKAPLSYMVPVPGRSSSKRAKASHSLSFKLPA